MKNGKVLLWRTDQAEAKRFSDFAELQRAPKPKLEPTGEFWAGFVILAMCAALGYLFWFEVSQGR